MCSHFGLGPTVTVLSQEMLKPIKARTAIPIPIVPAKPVTIKNGSLKYSSQYTAKRANNEKYKLNCMIDQCQQAGITQPIYPGIMPIINYKNLIRFSDSCGAEVPRWLRKALENYGDDDASLKAFGVELVTDLCDTLLENGAPGLHFYTMNQTEPTAEIVRNLGLVTNDE